MVYLLYVLLVLAEPSCISVLLHNFRLSIQLFQKKLSKSIVDTGTERNFDILSDNAPAKVVIWLLYRRGIPHYDEPALYILQSRC